MLSGGDSLKYKSMTRGAAAHAVPHIMTSHAVPSSRSNPVPVLRGDPIQ
jgi:hypothetical protein